MGESMSGNSIIKNALCMSVLLCTLAAALTSVDTSSGQKKTTKVLSEDARIEFENWTSYIAETSSEEQAEADAPAHPEKNQANKLQQPSDQHVQQPLVHKEHIREKLPAPAPDLLARNRV